MQYSRVRDKIQSGDIVALSHYKWASLYDLKVQAVRLFTQSEYSHVGVALVFGGRVWMVESVTPVVRIVPLSNYVKDGFYLIQNDTPMTQVEQEFLLSKVGISEYSQWQAIKAYFHQLNIGEDNIFECAEYVICARKISGMNLGDVATPSAVVKEAGILGCTIQYIDRE